MKRQIIFICCSLLLILSSCGKDTRKKLLPSISGRAGDVLVVVSDETWNSPTGKNLASILEQEMAGLTQDEPIFDISRINHATFSDLFKTTRNIIWVEVSDRYSSGKATFFKDYWAKGQCFIKLQAPDTASLNKVLDKERFKILTFMLKAERERYLSYVKRYPNSEIMKIIQDHAGVQLYVPNSMLKYKKGKNFMWVSNMNSQKRLDLAVYWYDYKGPETFNLNYLVQKRDSFLRKNIPGPKEGSYMATELRFPPSFEEITVDSAYCAQMRGMWYVIGDMMGGPFISHSRVDPINNRVVTVEGFVYAPNKKKRNYMWQLESILHSLKFLPEQKQ